MYWRVNNFCGLGISQKLLVDSFEWRKDKFGFDKEFIQEYDEDNTSCTVI